MNPVPPNQLRPDLIPVTALNPFIGHDHHARIQMLSAHLGQKLPIFGATERRCQSGVEADYGKYTFSVKMPANGKILKIVDRYRESMSQDSINYNPQTVVIWENDETKEIGIINIPKYCSHHQHFGFEYAPKEGMNKLFPNQFIAKDTIFMDSPAITSIGGYKYGIELNLAMMSHPSCSEDGIMICVDVLKRLGFKTYETRVVEWGNSQFPLNLYGDKDNFKPFPEIGDRVGPDGRLMAFRSYDKALAPVEQSIYDLMVVDEIFDQSVYAGPGYGRIVDIIVDHDDNDNSPTPMGMEKQIEKYVKARRSFYQEIREEYNRLRKEKGAGLQITPEFNELLVEQMAALNEGNDQKITKLHKQNPLDDYRVKFIIEYDITPTIGFKLTGLHGNKGVLCNIVSREMMPVDEAGNVADIVTDPNSPWSRLNPGGPLEQYINSASRDVSKMVRTITGIAQEQKNSYVKTVELSENNPEVFDKAYNYLMGYYSILSPLQHKRFSFEVDRSGQISHLASIIKDGVYLFLPTDNQPEYTEAVKLIEKHYRPTYGKVTYKGYSGNLVTTEENVRIGSAYILLLEKIGDDWAAVSSGKLQHHGVLAQLTKADKYSLPFRPQPVKILGESEGRIFAAYVGRKAVAEFMDRNNNPHTHELLVWNLLDADEPTNVDCLVNRADNPFGRARPIQIINHIAAVGGWSFAFKSQKKGKAKRW